MRKILLLITLLALCTTAFPQSFANLVGKTFKVDSQCRGQVSGGKVSQSGSVERIGGRDEFVLASNDILVWLNSGSLNVYKVNIDSDGDIEVISTISGIQRKWFQLLKSDNGSLTIWSDDSYLRYCTVAGGVSNTNNISNNNASASLPANFKPGNFTSDQIAKANTVGNASYLTNEEKLVIIYCNLARLDGATFVSSYLSDLRNSSNSYERSLLKELPQVKNLPMLYPNQKMYDAAKYHVNDIGPKGLVQHESSDGTSMGKRLRNYFGGGFIAENISFGYSDAMQIVRQLLIDDGVAGCGHRRNILGEKYTRIGTAIGTHKQYRNMCVQDFSDSQGD